MFEREKKEHLGIREVRSWNAFGQGTVILLIFLFYFYFLTFYFEF